MDLPVDSCWRRRIITVGPYSDELRAVLDDAVRDKQLGSNPAAEVKRPTVDHHEAEFLTPAQVRGLLDAAQGSRYAPLFEFLVNTAMRRGEALALRWRDVNEDAGTLLVRGTMARMDGELTVTTPKTKHSRRVAHLSHCGPLAQGTAAASTCRATGGRLAVGRE